MKTCVVFTDDMRIIKLSKMSEVALLYKGSTIQLRSEFTLDLYLLRNVTVGSLCLTIIISIALPMKPLSYNVLASLKTHAHHNKDCQTVTRHVSYPY